MSSPMSDLPELRKSKGVPRSTSPSPAQAALRATAHAVKRKLKRVQFREAAAFWTRRTTLAGISRDTKSASWCFRDFRW